MRFIKNSTKTNASSSVVETLEDDLMVSSMEEHYVLPVKQGSSVSNKLSLTTKLQPDKEFLKASQKKEPQSQAQKNR